MYRANVLYTQFFAHVFQTQHHFFKHFCRGYEKNMAFLWYQYLKCDRKIKRWSEHTHLGHGLSQKPARIGMITARQRVGLHVPLALKKNITIFSLHFLDFFPRCFMVLGSLNHRERIFVHWKQSILFKHFFVLFVFAYLIANFLNLKKKIKKIAQHLAFFAKSFWDKTFLFHGLIRRKIFDATRLHYLIVECFVLMLFLSCLWK